MKLCRFELRDEPGTIRSGMVFSGKVYETNGGEAIGVHEVDQVRPLAPIKHAPSIRVYRTDLQEEEQLDPKYFFSNPSNLVGSNHYVGSPEISQEFTFLPMIAAIAVSDAHQIETLQSDEIVLGVTLINLLVSTDQFRSEKRIGSVGGSHDFGGVIGPVITTPDELDDNLESEENGRKYSLEAVARIGGVEVARGNINNLPFTFAQAISAASQNGPIREGDVFAFGPIVDFESPITLSPGDEVQIAVEKLGTLSFKLASENL